MKLLGVLFTYFGWGFCILLSSYLSAFILAFSLNIKESLYPWDVLLSLILILVIYFLIKEKSKIKNRLKMFLWFEDEKQFAFRSFISLWIIGYGLSSSFQHQQSYFPGGKQYGGLGASLSLFYFFRFLYLKYGRSPKDKL